MPNEVFPDMEIVYRPKKKLKKIDKRDFKNYLSKRLIKLSDMRIWFYHFVATAFTRNFFQILLK